MEKFPDAKNVPESLTTTSEANEVPPPAAPGLTRQGAQEVGGKIMQFAEEPQIDTQETESTTAFAELAQQISETSTEAYEVLNATNPDAYTEFIENPELRRPNNERAKLNQDEIFGKLNRIRELEDELAQGDYSDKQKRILETSLEANKTENSFVAACILYNESPTEENAILQRWANKKLYGEPDRDTFLALLHEQIDAIEARDLSPEEQKELWDMKIIMGPIEKVKQERYRPSQETIDRFAEMAEDYFAPIFEHIPDGKEEFSIQEAADIAEEILQDIVPEDSEWHAMVDPDRRAATVSQTEKKIYFPGQRAKQTYSRNQLKKILVHELGTHAMRSIPFENHDVGTLRTGLPGYAGFEDGVAVVMEQAVDRKYRDAGVRHYINIGLANFMGKDFRDTYEIQKRLNHLSGTNDSDKLIFNSVQRAYRGTDVLPNNKDLIYYNGNAETWKFIEQNLDDPELFDKLFLSSKSDIANPEHERIVYEAKAGGI